MLRVGTRLALTSFALSAAAALGAAASALVACGSTTDGTSFESAPADGGSIPGTSGDDAGDDLDAAQLPTAEEASSEDATTPTGDAQSAKGDAAAEEGGGAGEASFGEAGPSDECAGGAAGPASNGSGPTAQVQGYGDVEFTVSTKTQITRLRTTMAVPAKPPASGTLFLWPGLEPLTNGTNYDPIGEGVLQPVLTWGGTCAPTAPSNYDSWWISAQYVNTYGSHMGYTGCLGGQGIDVAVGDLLDIDMALAGTVWKQTVTDRATSAVATYSLDMMAQAQNWALFIIESDGSKPVSDVIFTSTTLDLADADAAACQPSARGQTDYFSPPRASPDGKTCCVSKIILRASGVAATSPNSP